MEIERKWLVNGWPQKDLSLTVIKEHEMEQGYISTQPTVRLRKEALIGGKTEYILCFKSGGGLVRQEIELPLQQEVFEELTQKIIEKPMIPKLRRSYALPGGLTLEVSQVDKNQATAFYYAEIEFDTEEQALAWNPKQAHVAAAQSTSTPALDLSGYLNHEVTNETGQTMSEYWEATRG